MIAEKNKSLEFLAGGGEMGERIRNFDWNNTVLGDYSQWSESLKATTAMMLSNRFPMLLWWGQDYICLYNDAYIPILGSKHPWALGKPVSECWHEIWDVLKPLIDGPFFEGTPTWLEDLQLQLNRNDFFEETHFTVAYSPVPDPSVTNGTGGVLAIVNETTNQVINQRALDTMGRISTYCTGMKTEKEVYDKAAAAIAENKKDFPFAFFYTMNDERNKAELISSAGFIDPPPAFTPGAVIDLKAPPHYNIAKAFFENTLVCSGNNEQWTVLPKGDWDKMPSLFVHVPINNPNQKLPSAVLTVGLNPYRKFDDNFRDFIALIATQVAQAVNNALAYEAERKRAEVMEELDKAKTIFFTNISHEFRTPITLLLGNIEEILNDRSLNPKNVERLEIANRNAMRLLRLVNSLLDFSRIESGRQQASFTLTDIIDLTKNLSSNFRSVIEKAGLKLIIEADAFIKSVYLDTQMWEKIVFNLLSNAFKFTLEGTVTVALSSTDTHAVLKIKDTGVGIPEKELPHIFERFRRVENSAGRTFEGTGIGLSLVKELVLLHGGNIFVESEEGKGTTFTVMIPFDKENLPQSKITTSIDEFENPGNALIDEAVLLLNEPHEINVPVNNNNHQETIMIVDDNADMRHHLQSLLQNFYHVVQASNGMDALHKIREQRPSLILSDIMMPVMDGNRLLKELRSNPQTQDIPLVFLTARAGQESRMEGYETGADDYMVKPFSSKELLSRINIQLKLKQKQQEAVNRIRESERFLQNIISKAPFMAAVFEGEDLVVKIANQKFQQYLQRSREELMDKPIFDVVPEAVKQGFKDLLLTVLRTGEPFVATEIPVELMQQGKLDNSYLDLVYEPLRNENNIITGVIYLGIDVTDKVVSRKKIEEKEKLLKKANEGLETKVQERTQELLRQKEFVEHIINSSKELFAVWNKDFRLTLVNEASLKAMRKTKKEVLGKTLFELNPAAKGSRPEMDLHRVFAGETITNKPYFSEWANKWIQNYLVPLKDECGDIYAALTIAQDVTEILSTQEELKRSQQHFITLFNMSPVAMSISHVSDGTVIDVNPAWEKLFERTRAAVLGKNAANVGLTKRKERESAMEEVKQKGGTVHGLEQRFDLGNNKFIFTHTSVVSIELDGTQCYLAGYFDISQRKRYEAQIIESAKQFAQKNVELESMNKELESFNYVASHDLQEPLRKIQTFINIIKDRNPAEEEKNKYLEKIDKAAQRMTALIRAVLTYSKLSNSEEQFSDIDLNTILDDVKADFELLIEETNAHIKSSKLPVIRANALQMHQLFSNLISNAIKFCKEAPRINIKASIVTGDKITADHTIIPKGKFVQLSFADNGIGFDPKYKDQIFTLFQRLHGKHEFTGTGIGLSITKKITEYHKGFISADSKPGEGTVFTVWLPVKGSH